jgi:hypothetical protein
MTEIGLFLSNEEHSGRHPWLDEQGPRIVG